MLTYEDFEKLGGDESKIADFIRSKIDEQEQNERYMEGVTAGEFYRGGDPAMQKYEKIIYDVMGAPRKEIFSANNKLTANFYNLFITQEVSYLLGNGISFDDETIKERLGNGFDYDLQDLLTWAANDSESYALLKSDGIEKLCVGCDDEEPHFIPIFSAYDKTSPRAGFKHWRLDDNSPLNVELYTPTGYSVWREVDSKLQIVEPEKPYDLTYSQNAVGERWNVQDNSGGALPIVPLIYPNHKSAIHNKKETLTAYNLVLSGLVNNMTEVNLLYWVIRNADGMDDQDYEDFITNLYKSKVLPLPDGVEADPHEINTDHEGHESTLARLREQLFQDFKAVDVQSVMGGNKTTVEIKAAYENLNLKCDNIEKQVGRFVRKVLKFYGFDENTGFSFTRPPNINLTEYMTMIEQIKATVGEDTALKWELEALGKIDQYEEIARQKAADEQAMMIRATQAMQAADGTGGNTNEI